MIQHYQTCFRVEANDDKLFRNIQKLIFDWVCGKESDPKLHLDWKNFNHYGKWSPLWPTKNILQTAICYGDNSRSWAMNYVEQDKEHGPLRFWHTDVGLREISNEIIIAVRISYASNQTDLTNFQVAPDTSVPRFIRSILSGSLKVYCRSKEFRLTEKPISSKLTYGKATAEWIMNIERHYPILVFNGNNEALTAEATFLARSLAGKCQVLLMPEDKEFAAELRCYLPKDFNIPHNYFRVFFPLNPKNNSPSRHRWYDITSESYSVQRKGIINGLLRNYPTFDREAVETIADIYRRISQSKLEKFRKENPKLEAELATFYTVLEETEKDRDEQKAFANMAATESDEKSTEITELKRQIFQHGERIKQAEAKRPSSNLLDTLISLPRSLEDILKIFGEHVPERLVITAEALSSAANYAAFDSIHEAWEMLSDLSRLVHDMKFKPPKDFSGDFEAYFNAKSRYELTMTETAATKKDKALMDLRQVEFGGKAFDVTPHIKWGSKEPKLLRIHFAFDEEHKKIIIGFVGQHLRTAGTRKL